jgi:phospholipid/cholesterol/gamma-HCH transport system substrate-binding protein
VRRLAAILAAIAVAALVVVGMAAGGEDGGYKVRAIFDNGAFLVKGEDVRVAGATVGHVESVDVTGLDEPAHADGSPEPGKAVVVMDIEEAGVQDFREDASCLIRPQSLLGEKFVDCRVTEPRAAGSEPPMELEVIPEGEPGAGERFLPLENNGKAVDLDLVNNIMREPYADRFRLILNDLGAGLAARGDELASIVERSNPALRETDRVLAILAKQNRTLANLARDGARIMAPLARERAHIRGFINNANVTAEASAERNPDLEASLERLPAFLRELRLTMGGLRRFSDSATPTVTALGDAAPAITRATEALGPFSEAGIPALRTLGNAAEQSGPDLIASDPLIKDLGRLGKETEPAAKGLAKLLGSLERTGGYRRLLEFVFYSAGGVNGFDEFGHFVRAVLPPNSCTHYSELPSTASCNAHFAGSTPISQAATATPKEAEDRTGADEALNSVLDAVAEAVGGSAAAEAEAPEEEPAVGAEPPVEDSGEAVPDAAEPPAPKSAAGGTDRSMRELDLLMSFLLEDGR